MLGEQKFVAKIVVFLKKSSDWGASHTSLTITLSLPRRDTAAALLLHAFLLQHEIAYAKYWCSSVLLESLTSKYGSPGIRYFPIPEAGSSPSIALFYP